jgi:flagellar protein FliO/FliZ
MFDLFGSELPLAARFFIAFLVVLALIGMSAWLVRRYGASRLGRTARGRQPRLAVIEAASIDARRRLVLIRRDNIEHLLMIGGPADVVVEQNIMRAAVGREAPRESARAAVAEPSQRTATVPAAAPEIDLPWQAVSTEPPPVAPSRPYRAPAIDEPWLPHEPGTRARSGDSLAVLTTDLSTRRAPPQPEAPPPQPPVARTELPRPTPTPLPPAAQTDRNLAEMAKQLEAALRRSPMQEGRPPVTDPLAQPPAKTEAPPHDFHVGPESKFESKPEPNSKIRSEPTFEPKFDSRPEPRFEIKQGLKPEHKPEPKFDYRPEPKHEPPPGGPRTAEAEDKNLYDNLEEEMASLLGRPSGKT